MKKYLLPAVLCLFCLPALHAQIQRVYDVVPTENITSLEFNPSLDVLDHSKSTSLSKMTMKGAYKLTPLLSVGAEVPFARYESPADSKNGLGDITLSLSAGRYTYGDTWSFGGVLETIWPTASYDELGTGKVQMNPSFYGVYTPTPNWFVALGYKQYWSVAGDGGRDNINYGRIRLAMAYLSDNKWWVVLDPQYYINYDIPGQAHFSPEAEIGTMINEGTAIYLRASGKMGGNMPNKDWGISMGFRVLYL